MPRGGRRPGAGRPRKDRTPDELQEFEDRLAAEKALPDPPADGEHRYKTSLEFAMAIINDDEKPLAERRRLAIAALPYQHEKLAERPAGKKEQKGARAKQVASAGRFSTPSAPRLVADNTK